MARAFIIVIDSFGIGGAPDAKQYGDEGATTLGHIADACMRGQADIPGSRSGALKLPNLTRLGLGAAAFESTGIVPAGLNSRIKPVGAYGAAAEKSRGKDTPSGHWEMAGLPVLFDWGYFPKKEPCFPDELISELIHKGNLPGILGNRHASGTQIITELGEEHCRTGKPICYTSTDSVFQIAAHEEMFGLQKLYNLCIEVEKMIKPYNIGRVIARPFVGDSAETFRRTANRRDLTVPPHESTLLDEVYQAGSQVISIGKIADIFAHRSITLKLKASDTNGLFDLTVDQIRHAPPGSLVFSNYVDFDMLYGHRRDIAGYAAALEALDARLPELEQELQPGDLAVITADHGCDPTWPGSDHTRENVPVLFFGPDVVPQNLGLRETFADIGQTLASHLQITPLKRGVDCFSRGTRT
ncbi:MAG: phosphopentomutase [Gammaproteobacteria bacterium]|nr:phosphopentomutase [Gammaproteobacteria bacterium]